MPAQPRIPFSRPEITEEDIRAVTATLRSGSLSMGEQVAAFEAELSKRCGTRHAVALSNGTAALHLSLLAAGLKPGDQVITTPFTYVATVNAIIHAGATPVFTDIEHDSLNLDMKKVEARLTPRTRAVLPVHVFGRPCAMAPLVEFARAHRLALIEDACEALGSKYRGRPVGGFGLAGTFGFAPNKQITTAEGGALVTDHDDVAAFARSMRRQGRSTTSPDDGYIHAGYNYRMSDVHAALGLAQLRRLDDHIRARQAAAALYRRHLAGIEDITLPAAEQSGTEVSWFVWVVLVDRDLAGKARDRILHRLNQRGVGAVHYFPALHLQPFLAPMGHRRGDFPVTEEVAARTIALPFFPGITEEQVLAVKTALAEELAAARSSAR